VATTQGRRRSGVGQIAYHTWQELSSHDPIFRVRSYDVNGVSVCRLIYQTSYENCHKGFLDRA